ncbi:DEKNAAC103522 [Brettanomyces naardenensis]|uniref:DEKNAAC103522 n=1 Tax=Brettanomyces naardenensis TaxID=13370 RepID=A0A448YN20_BRENA|nr:DEKNAAC103522 [Brettanomyces naardenensis]
MLKLRLNPSLRRQIPLFNLSPSKYALSRHFYSTQTAQPSSKPIASTSSLTDFSRTKVVNQQYSEHNGLPLFIAISPEATKQLNQIAREETKPELALRISVESGGCHGFQYVFKLTDTSEYKPEEGDSMFNREGAKVMMDKTSLEILRDSKVDYVHELIGSQFKVVDSPYSKSSCGCGSSFDIDFEKLEGGK